jgi:hypoxanthine phosphoribosyltransferase
VAVHRWRSTQRLSNTHSLSSFITPTTKEPMPLSKPRLIQELIRRIPPSQRADLVGVLIPEVDLQKRIALMGKAIAKDYKGKDVLVVSLLSGTVLFLADLLRRLDFPLRVDFLGVSSYGSGTESGKLVFNKELKLDVRGSHVLVVDDILDTGKTLRAVTEKILALKPASIRTCVLLDKKERRVGNIEADYVGFQIPDWFVVGYGLDFAERYRNLPYVGVLKPEVYAPKQSLIRKPSR